jgi:PadR family transcriptional regulator PadR
MTIPTLRVLAALLADPLGEHYGLALCRAAGLPRGTVYPILARLEGAGWLVGAWEDIDERAEGRRRRRYYRLTGDGIRAGAGDGGRPCAGRSPGYPSPTARITGQSGWPSWTGSRRRCSGARLGVGGAEYRGNDPLGAADPAGRRDGSGAIVAAVAGGPSDKPPPARGRWGSICPAHGSRDPRRSRVRALPSPVCTARVASQSRRQGTVMDSGQCPGQ